MSTSNQCTKIGSDGVRCSNRAQPGSEFCEEHRERIQFHRKPSTEPVGQESDSTPEPAEQSAAEVPAVSETPAVAEPAETAASLQASPDADDNLYPLGLRRDKRHILVAPQAILHLPDTTRWAQVLGALSYTMDLTNTAIWRHRDHGCLIRIEPQDPETDNLSTVYDAIDNLAAIDKGQLFIGANDRFVRYRDEESPFGYSLPEDPGEKDGVIRLFATETVEIPNEELEDVSMSQAVLELVPANTQRRTETPDRIFVLTAEQMRKTLCRYFRSHHLAYSLVRIPCGEGRVELLFQVDAGLADKGAVPQFVIAYLQSFPRTVVFQEEFQEDERQVLVELGCVAPWNWENTMGVFPSGGLLLMCQSRDYPNLWIEPAPILIDGDTLVEVTPKDFPAHVAQPDTTAPELPPVSFELRFERDRGPNVPPVARLLREHEMNWLRRLLYRMPTSEFSQYRVHLAKPYSLLVTDGESIRDLPLGIALKRVQDSALYIPCELKLIPDLPLHVLTGVLNVQAENETILTPDVRLEIERSSFVPMSDLVYSGLSVEPVPLEWQRLPAPPDFQWEMPDELRQMLEEADRAGQEAPSGGASGSFPVGPMGGTAEGEPDWQSEAQRLRTQGDYLGEALVMILAGQSAVDQLRTQAERLSGGSQP